MELERAILINPFPFKDALVFLVQLDLNEARLESRKKRNYRNMRNPNTEGSTW